MLALRDLQRTMAQAVLSGETAALRPAIHATGTDATARLGIYCNHTLLSLTDVLQTTFPIVMQVVDQRFFRWLAAEFIRAHPPAEPRLSTYGARLPSFIAHFEACRALPFLADLARLEWAINTAIHAAELPGLGMAALAGVAPQRLATSRLRLQPSLRFVLSRYPILRIWQAHQPGQDGTVSLHRDAGEPSADRITVRRRDRGVALLAHHAQRFRLLRDLARGRSLDAALARSLDPETELIALFRESLVTAIDPPTMQPTSKD